MNSATDDRRVRVPQGLDSADALLVAPVAQALRIWRRLGLELGEAAVYTDGHALADFIGLVAVWHGAVPVVRLTTRDIAAIDVAAIDGIDTVSVGDAAGAVERLRALTANAPGLAAVDLSGSGSAVGILLEALPRWGRLALGGSSPEPFTTAFYTDIHRKGVVVSAVGDLDSVFADPTAWDLEVRNAGRLLEDPKRAARLRACASHRLVPPAIASGTGT